jgi:uncharacterized membrane protein
MEGVEQVDQIDDKRLHWVANVGGKRKEWDTEITEQIPEQHIAWRSINGPENSGVVHFTQRDHGHTLITLQMKYEPEGLMEKMGDAMGLMSRRVESDLQRFKDFIQHRGTETGAWRGEIRGEQVKKPGSTGTHS